LAWRENLPLTIRYHFTQAFNVSAKQAFLWCTSFSPDDPKIMELDYARREVTKISNDTVILTEQYQTEAGAVEKQKLVQLYPTRLMWISTHLSGPNQHSQFLYEITPQGEDASKLDFTAQHIEPQNLSEEAAQVLAKSLCEYDTKIWRRLSAAMEHELKETPP
jgi:hypothetical protein